MQELQLEQNTLHKRLGQMHDGVDKVEQWGREIAALSQANADAARANLPPESHARVVKNFHKASHLLALGVHNILWLDSNHQMPCLLPGAQCAIFQRQDNSVIV